MITTYLLEQIPNCEAVSDNGDGSYRLDFPNGESRLATLEEVQEATAKYEESLVIVVDAWQLMQALVHFNLYNQIDAAVTALNNPLAEIGWRRANTFHANNPLILSVAAAAGITQEQIQAVFEYAKTL